jgi:hypothetical protein
VQEYVKLVVSIRKNYFIFLKYVITFLGSLNYWKLSLENDLVISISFFELRVWQIDCCGIHVWLV